MWLFDTPVKRPPLDNPIRLSPAGIYPGLPPPETFLTPIQNQRRRDSSSRREGLGLGLHICSQIVRAHGGQLSVTSTKGNGNGVDCAIAFALGAIARRFPTKYYVRYRT